MSFAATDVWVAGRTLVVGLGNPILGDDGVGWCIADRLESRLTADLGLDEALGPTEIDRLSVGGLTLMERLVGYEKAVIADAAVDGWRPGTVWSGDPAELAERTAEHLDSAHDVTLARAMEMATQLGAELPRELFVVTVSVTPMVYFAESLSVAVEAAVDQAVDVIVDHLMLAHVGSN